MENITDFLYLIGSVFAPMIAIQIADFFLLKKDHSGSAFDLCNLVIWVIGFVLYRFLMRLDIPVATPCRTWLLPCFCAWPQESSSREKKRKNKTDPYAEKLPHTGFSLAKNPGAKYP